MKYGINIFKIFKASNVALVEKILVTTIGLLPVDATLELVLYYVKNIAATIVLYSRSILYELFVLGLDIAKLSVLGIAMTVFFNIVLRYFPKLYDSINMIIYGLSGRCYYRDVKLYGINYYNKK